MFVDGYKDLIFFILGEVGSHLRKGRCEQKRNTIWLTILKGPFWGQVAGVN